MHLLIGALQPLTFEFIYLMFIYTSLRVEENFVVYIRCCVAALHVALRVLLVSRLNNIVASLLLFPFPCSLYLKSDFGAFKRSAFNFHSQIVL